MNSKQKNNQFKNSYVERDSLDNLLGNNAKNLGKRKSSRGGAGHRLSIDDDFFQKLAEEAKMDVEDSDVSEADPNDILKNMKDVDDMDADLFGSKKKPSSAPAQTKSFGNSGPQKDPPKLEGTASALKFKKPSSAPSSSAYGHKKFNFSDLVDPLDDLLNDLLPEETKAEPNASTQKSELSPPVSPIMKKNDKVTTPKKREELTFDDDEDDLIDALGFDSDKDRPKKKETMIKPNRESGEPLQRARTRLDEILESGTSPRLLERPLTGERKEQLLPLGRKEQEKTSTAKEALLEDDLTFCSYQPTLASTPEGRQSRRQSVRFSTEDVSVSTPERKPKPATPATPTTPTSARPRNSADWLGLKSNNEYHFVDEESKEPKNIPDTPKASSSPLAERRFSPSGSRATPAEKTTAETPATPTGSSIPPKAEALKSQRTEEEEDDWLTGALSRKKAHSKQEDSLGLGKQVELDSLVSKQACTRARNREEDTVLSIKEPRETSHSFPSPTAHSTPVGEEKPLQDPLSSPQSPLMGVQHVELPQPLALTFPPPQDFPAKIESYSCRISDHHQKVADPKPSPASSVSHPLPLPPTQSQPHPSLQESRKGWPSQTSNLSANYQALQCQPLTSPTHTVVPGSMQLPQQSQMQSTGVQQQVTLTADSLQLLLQQQLLQPQLLALGGALDAGTIQRQKEKECQLADHQSLQARIIQLEGQVRTLQLERDQTQMLLESVQQRHQQDTELMENTHKARAKLLEESAAQRELRARQECEDLTERLATVARLAEQERSELQAQHQRRLAQAQQDRDREVERLRDLQRKSILEMKKDHEEQVLRLKRLKDEEVDAVTSATSQTRSLTVVIEQMEQFSHRLGDLSSRVESTHEHTAQGLEQGARQREEQLRVIKDRHDQQQRAMAEERARLKEVIARMDTQLAEQQRQLEKERWRVAAEQAKAESAQRGLEEERRSLTTHISMEREELERAKSALLEEQQSVMQHCAEERRKLSAEWAQFHAQEKQRQGRAEREASRALEVDAHRQGSIISMAQEQADLKLRAGELKQKEEALFREREALDRQREELDREKERISSAGLRLRSRAQEVEAFSKIATQKYEEGEQALQEAKTVQAEHQARLRSVHSQMDRLRQQEQCLHQERTRMTSLRGEMERLNHGLPITIPPVVPPVFTDLRQMPPSLVPLPTASPESTELQARLALLKHTAEKDRDYLQDEQFFLDTLKKAPYNSTAFHTH